MNTIFVYGTLKRGFCRHHVLESQDFLGSAWTTPVYRLYDLGNYPGLVQAADGVSIEGELYAVDDTCLRELDIIEAVNEGLYFRQLVKLAPPWSNHETQTYIYRHSIEGFAEIERWTMQSRESKESTYERRHDDNPA